jgi:hypothetical protein
MPEEGLDLGGVGSAQAEARAIGLPAAVGTQSGDTDVGANGQVVGVGLHVHAVGGHRGAVPHAWITSSSAKALTCAAIAAQRSLPRSIRRLRTIDSSRADTPAMCGAASHWPMLTPPVNTVTQYRPSGSQLLGSEPQAGPKWWCQPSQQVVRATTGNCDRSGIRRAIAPASFPAACGVPAPRRRLRAGTPPSGSSISGLETNATVGRAAS